MTRLLRYLVLLTILSIPAWAQVATNRVILGDPPGGAGAACTAPATNIYLASTGLEYTCFMSVWSSVGSAGSGTVTSVAASFTGGLVSVGGSPVTTAGTLAFTVAGTSGGVPYFSGAATWASSAALTANLPMIGGGAGNPPSVGTRSGNTTAFVTTTGAQTSGDCVKIDANGNHVANGSACAGGSGTVTVVGAGSLTSTALVTGGGSQTIQTPAATATMDSSGNISTPGSISTGAGSGAAGAASFGQGTACTPSANYICEYAPASVTAYGVVKPGTVGVTGIVHNTVSGSVRTELAPSLIVNADITNATIDLTSKVTGVLPAANMTQVSPTAGTSVSLTSAISQMFVCTSTCTVTVPVPAAGAQYCVYNDDNVATVITLSAIGSSSRYENTARTAYGTSGTGTFVSGGAVGDAVCIVFRDTTHYSTLSHVGTWVAN